MIKKIPAYKCSVCKKIIMGSKTEAEKHENLPVVEPLPTGFVYFNKEQNSYEVVSKAPGVRLESHDYRQEVISLIETDERLELYEFYYEHGPHDELAGYVRSALGFEELGRLFGRFEKFKKMYSKSDPEIKRRIGLQAKDLTNKL